MIKEEISIIFLLYVTITMISIFKFFSLRIYKKKHQFNNKDTLYGHQIKSFIDTFKNNILSCLMYLFIVIAIDEIKYYQIVTTLIANSFIPKWYIESLMIFLSFMCVIPCSIFMYSFSEIKHLSPNDSIGYNINKLELKDKNRKKAKKHYIITSLSGGIGILLIINLGFLIGIKYAILTIILTAVIFLLGMGDVLQHKNYNSEDYLGEFKTMSLRKKFFLENIIELAKSKDLQKNARTQMNINLYNIVLGFKQIFLRASKST